MYQPTTAYGKLAQRALQLKEARAPGGIFERGFKALSASLTGLPPGIRLGKKLRQWPFQVIAGPGGTLAWIMRANDRVDVFEAPRLDVDIENPLSDWRVGTYEEAQDLYYPPGTQDLIFRWKGPGPEGYKVRGMTFGGRELFYAHEGLLGCHSYLATHDPQAGVHRVHQVWRTKRVRLCSWEMSGREGWRCVKEQVYPDARTPNLVGEVNGNAVLSYRGKYKTSMGHTNFFAVPGADGSPVQFYAGHVMMIGILQGSFRSDAEGGISFWASVAGSEGQEWGLYEKGELNFFTDDPRRQVLSVWTGSDDRRPVYVLRRVAGEQQRSVYEGASPDGLLSVPKDTVTLNAVVRIGDRTAALVGRTTREQARSLVSDFRPLQHKTLSDRSPMYQPMDLDYVGEVPCLLVKDCVGQRWLQVLRPEDDNEKRLLEHAWQRVYVERLSELVPQPDGTAVSVHTVDDNFLLGSVRLT